MRLRFFRAALASVGVALAAAGASPALAALGGAYGSVQGDRAHMAASLHAIAASTHTQHVLTLANGAVVKEFTRTDGTVFAVAWTGPSRPDLRQLLGDHFAAFQTENANPTGRRMRRPLTVRHADLIVTSAGRPGDFHGYAYLPQMTPAGFSLKDMQ